MIFFYLNQELLIKDRISWKWVDDRVNQGEKPKAKTKLISLYRFTNWLKKKKTFPKYC